jgi:hypothetical protein
MNWKEISKCPKAWRKLFEKYKGLTYDVIPNAPDGEVVLYSEHYPSDSRFELRKLFDFFDEQELNIEIGIDWNNLGYIYRIGCGTWVQSYSTRTEAEEKAFTKAFQLLEEKLNGDEK